MFSLEQKLTALCARPIFALVVLLVLRGNHKATDHVVSGGKPGETHLKCQQRLLTLVSYDEE
ncbi:hypothetical protein CH063_03909 [Colletotrichum higginsianum]|uniref:Uncharacterized protein n=1 Tax=Colletotrichum higginsianum (strain IMI 349063) TaxID=759273 RepID=H1W292_COLHI|nr:hypothetical protein CH063_03909 [Colletotrichum higginsianum]